MLLDDEFFGTTLLPRILARAHRDGVAAQARDARADRRVGGAAAPATWTSVERDLPWVFADWTVVVSGPPGGAERWARASFAYNMTLAVLLAAALLGGILFALRAASRAVQLSEMKSDFVSNVSHELRTPLASIRALGELLKLGRASPDKVREYGGHIETESRRLSRLIDNLLDFSRIESGRKTYRFAQTRLEDVVAAAVETFDVRAKEAGFRVEYRRPETPLPTLALDADAIGQAVHNLLDNAAKYSGESRRIEVTVGEEPGWAVCTVRDFGIGIPADEQRRVFERFHRVGSGLVHDVAGTGLGLSIVQHVLQAHRGEASIASEPGNGTTVRLRLPLGAAGAPAAPAAEKGGDECPAS
jgi:signal transduction histidine kinase